MGAECGREKADRVRDRDGWRCVRCGRKPWQIRLEGEYRQRADDRYMLQVHHVKTSQTGGRNVLDNLITLCPRCHGHVHKHMRRGRFIGMVWGTQDYQVPDIPVEVLAARYS